MTRPRVVVVELCVSRLNILRFDEETILEEAKNINMGKDLGEKKMKCSPYVTVFGF